MNTKGYVYGLVDPRDGVIRYIGKSINFPTARYTGHLSDAKTTNIISRKVKWMRELIDADLTPDIVVLDVVDCDKLLDAEQAWILKLWDQPGHLVNLVGAPDYKEYLREFYAARMESWAQGKPGRPVAQAAVAGSELDGEVA